MKPIHHIMIGILALSMLTACSSEEQELTGDHVFKTQEQALEKARAVEQTLDDAMLRQNQAIQDATQ